MLGLKKMNRLLAVLVVGVLLLAVAFGFYFLLTSKTAFSREQAIAKASELVETALYTHGGEVEEIQAVHAEILTRGQAFQRIGQPANKDANSLVWYVTVKAPFWSWSPPTSVEGETGYQKAEFRGDEHYYIIDAMTGEQEMYGSNGRFVGNVKFP